MSCIMCLKPNVERGNVKAYIPANFGTHSLQSVAIHNMNRGRLNELFSFSPRSELYAVRFSEFFDLLLGSVHKFVSQSFFPSRQLKNPKIIITCPFEMSYSIHELTLLG